MVQAVNDLRSAIELLKEVPNQFLEIHKEVDLYGELTGTYKKYSAGGTVKRPTKLGPMMLFDNIAGHPGARVAIGVMGSRERVGHLLNTPPEKLGEYMSCALDKALPPILVPAEQAACHEEIYLASDSDFDIRELLAVPFTTVKDAGPYITMGLCCASDPDNKEHRNAAIHRMCIIGKDELTITIGGGRHLGAFRDKAFAKGENLPVSVNIGLDPAVYLTSCFAAPTTPLGFDELSVAGALRDKPVEMARCVAIDGTCIANAEIVIEGELVCGQQAKEDLVTNSGKALPEFPGYAGPAYMATVFKVKAVTCRKNPIMQVCIAASAEHVSLAGIPSEASVLNFLNRAMPGKVLNAYFPPSGGGKYNAILQFCKSVQADEGKQQQAALSVLAVHSEVKNVIVVDEDVDIFDPDDVLWALTTRFRPDLDLSCIPGVRFHPGDPTTKKLYDPTLRDNGLAYKTIYDATAPFELKSTMFKRPDYVDVDLSEIL